MRKLPPIESKNLTEIANSQGIKGSILIIDHNYYLDQPGIERRRIGFTRIQAQGFILRKAARLPIQNLEVEEPEPAPLPDQIDLIVPEGRLSLI